MLLPALNTGKAKAKQTQCVNNFKQVGLAILKDSGDARIHFQLPSPLDTKISCGSLLYSNQTDTSLSVFRGPSYPPYVYTNAYTNWFCTFGVWSDPPDTVTSGNLKQDIVLTSI